MLKENYYKENKNKIKDVLLNNSNKNSTGQEVVSRNDEWAKEKEWDNIFIKLAEGRGSRVNE
ncbi:hypothetical protein [Clostridium algidicarnis]|uniref:hypothetical protein n=1 Tax=Clostridium algidicarnis TaxID=37659 RepID=UPI00162ABBFB|nr:hypothetical protein [Clostridium algidicarnis]MBB6698777.1 hypothetical protein [Clostridium algidicarnis]